MLTGVILAGGRSLRYGKNKALEVFEGKRLIDRGVEALRAFCDPVIVVANDLSLYFDLRATLVQDLTPNQGSLGGLYTALLFSPNDWIVVRAVDMPFFLPEIMSFMLELRKDADVVVPMIGEHYEPLLALYHRRCLPAIAEVLEQSERQVIRFYQSVRVKTVPESVWRAVDPEGASFANINTPEDRERLNGTP